MVRKAHTVSVERPEGKSALGRPRCSWESNIKISLNQKVGEDVVWIYLTQEGVFNTFGYH